MRKIEDEPEYPEDDAEAEALMRTVLTSFDEYISTLTRSLAPEVFAIGRDDQMSRARMADMIASHLEMQA